MLLVAFNVKLPIPHLYTTIPTAVNTNSRVQYFCVEELSGQPCVCCMAGCMYQLVRFKPSAHGHTSPPSGYCAGPALAGW